MKVTPKHIHEKMVKQQAIELLDHLTVDEACVYLDNNCSEDEREEIVAAIWATTVLRTSAKKSSRLSGQSTTREARGGQDEA